MFLVYLDIIHHVFWQVLSMCEKAHTRPEYSRLVSVSWWDRGGKSETEHQQTDTISEKLRHQENRMLTETVAITDQLSRFILMVSSRRGSRLMQGEIRQRTWGEQARETTECRSIGWNEERVGVRMGGSRWIKQRERDGRREGERDRDRGDESDFWQILALAQSSCRAAGLH